MREGWVSVGETLEISDEVIAPGERRDLQLEFSETAWGAPVAIPLSVIRATEPGPIVYITGAIHGDEMNGMGIVRDLLYNTTPELLNGTLICAPVVNVYGLERATRYMPDRRDLNRSFPGYESGSLTARLAHALFNEVVLKSDFGIDLHTAAARRTNYPNVRADLQNTKLRRLAEDFGCELIVNSKGPSGSLRREAVDAGTPTIVFEAGEVAKIEPSAVDIGVRGCLNVLKGLGMVEGEPERPYFQERIRRTVWVRADSGGILSFHAKPGELVSKGQELATCHSLFGREPSVLNAPADGIVMGLATMPAVKPGEPVYHIARLGKKAFERVNKALARKKEAKAYTQVQRELATSITIVESTENNKE